MVKLIDILTMPKLLVNKTLLSMLLTAGLCLDAQAAVTTHTPNQKSLKFEHVFKSQGEPKALYFQSQFYSAADGRKHNLQVWRDGELHLRRKTDQAIDTYVIRDKANLNAYQMIVVDYNKRVTTKINRDNLIHLGEFNDWFDMSHGLRHPKGEYQLHLGKAPQASFKTFAPCQWYVLSQGKVQHHICWSEKDRIPLVIWDNAKSMAVWQVTTLNRQPIKKDVFTMHDAGFMRNDANADIEND